MNKTFSRLGLAALCLCLPAPLVLAQALLATPAGSKPIEKNRVLASRGGVSLLVVDVDAKIRSMPDDLRAGYLQDRMRLARLIDTLLLTKQLAAAASEQGIDKSPEVAEDLALAREELLARKLSEKNVAALVVPDFSDLAQERYLANSEKYMTPASVDLRHILISMDGKLENTAKAKAEKAHARAKSGEDFVKLVMEFSDEPSKDTRQGLIPAADFSRLDADFAKAARALKVEGEVSPPIRTRFGYHLIRLEKLTPALSQPFEQVRGQIVAELRGAFIDNEKTRLLSKYSQLETALDDDAIQALAERYAKPR